MSDVVEFINARLDEWEAAAKAATPGGWHANRDSVATAPEIDGDVAGEHVMHASFEDNGTANAAHIALNDPAAVLRMVAGLRAIVALHRPVDYSGLGMESPNACELCGIDAGMSDWEWMRDSWPCPTLLAIGAAMFPATPGAASEGGAG